MWIPKLVRRQYLCWDGPHVPSLRIGCTDLVSWGYQGGSSGNGCPVTCPIAYNATITATVEVTTESAAEDATTQGSAVDPTTQGSAVDATTQGSAVDATTQGSAVDATTQGSAVDATTQGSAVDATTQGSAVDATTQGSDDAEVTTQADDGGNRNDEVTTESLDLTTSGYNESAQHVTITINGSYSELVTPDEDEFLEYASQEILDQTGVTEDMIENLEVSEGKHYLLMTSWHGNTFRLAGPLWGESSSFPHNRPVRWKFYVFFVVNMYKLLNEQLSCQWFETLWHVTSP